MVQLALDGSTGTWWANWCLMGHLTLDGSRDTWWAKWHLMVQLTLDGPTGTWWDNWYLMDQVVVDEYIFNREMGTSQMGTSPETKMLTKHIIRTLWCYGGFRTFHTQEQMQDITSLVWKTYPMRWWQAQLPHTDQTLYAPKIYIPSRTRRGSTDGITSGRTVTPDPERWLRSIFQILFVFLFFFVFFLNSGQHIISGLTVTSLVLSFVSLFLNLPPPLPVWHPTPSIPISMGSNVSWLRNLEWKKKVGLDRVRERIVSVPTRVIRLFVILTKL